MKRIETTTTEFKKALKTVLDTMTEKEQKTYDVGIELVLQPNEAVLRMEHPTEKIIVSATFPSEHDVEARVLFYLGDLAEDLKQFRKKEALWLTIVEGVIELSVADGRLYEAQLDDERILMLPQIDYVALDKSAFIDSLNLSQAVTKRTFHASTSAIQFALSGSTLYAKATNFAQLYLGELKTEGATPSIDMFSLSAHLITKVRDVLMRDKSKHIQLTVFKEWVSMETETTTIAFERVDTGAHLVAKDVLSKLSYTTPSIPVELEKIKTSSNLTYAKWKEATDAKDTEGVATHSHVWLSLGDTCNVQPPLADGHPVYIKDMKNMTAKMTGDWSAQLSESHNVLQFTSQNKQLYRHTLIVPTDVPHI